MAIAVAISYDNGKYYLILYFQDDKATSEIYMTALTEHTDLDCLHTKGNTSMVCTNQRIKAKQWYFLPE